MKTYLIHDKLLNSKDVVVICPLFCFFDIGENVTHYLRKALRQTCFPNSFSPLYKIYQTLELKFHFLHWHVDKAVCACAEKQVFLKRIEIKTFILDQNQNFLKLPTDLIGNIVHYFKA